MVKSVLGVNHAGLTDWAIQRISAILMAIYSFSLMAYILSHPQLDFSAWHTLFTHTWLKIVTLIVLFSLVYHAWIGMWIVGTDYVKPTIIRIFYNLFVLFTLVASFIWGTMILWSV